MHRTRTVGGVIMIATGLVWVGQGTGFLRGSSFMVGDPLWTAFGVIAVAVGSTFVLLGLRHPR
jgi:hypothetical protein